MSSVIDTIERAQLRRVPVFQAGDRLRVHFQVVEGTRKRTQVFEGVVLKRQGSGARETFTVRKQSFGVGVERTFPVHSPKIERIEVAARGAVRRAKLYYLRDRVGRRARVRERRFTGQDVEVYSEGVMPPPAADAAATDAAATDPAATDVAEGAETAPPEPDPRNEGVQEVAEVPETESSAESGGSDAPGAEADAPPAADDVEDADERGA
jgi:large subunit ribosomal protein L19